MKLILKFVVAVCFLIPNTIADGAQIVAALNKIDAETNQLNIDIVEFDGTLLGALPVITDSLEILADIVQATNTARKSNNLTTQEAINVNTAVLTLSGDLNTTLANAERQKPKFSRLLLTPILALDLEVTKIATDQLASAIIEKIPPSLTAIANSEVAGIDAAFNEAIADFSQ